MRLSDYLSRHGIKPFEFAERIGANPSIISRLLRGERGVSLRTAAAIERATDGAVTVHDLLSEGEVAS